MRRTEIRVEPVDAFFEPARKTAQLADKREPIHPSRVVAFEEVEDWLTVLTQQRALLLPGHVRQKWVAPISREIQLTAHL